MFFYLLRLLWEKCWNQSIQRTNVMHSMQKNTNGWKMIIKRIIWRGFFCTIFEAFKLMLVAELLLCNLCWCDCVKHGSLHRKKIAILLLKIKILQKHSSTNALCHNHVHSTCKHFVLPFGYWHIIAMYLVHAQNCNTQQPFVPFVNMHTLMLQLRNNPHAPVSCMQ